VDFTFPKVFPGSGRLVDPWLAGLAVLEPAVGAANGDVEDEEEGLIEWRGGVAALGPGVDEGCSVRVGERELAAVPEGFLEVCVEHLHQAGVDVGIKSCWSPFKTVGVCIC